jgi:hypothetical protein
MRWKANTAEHHRTGASKRTVTRFAFFPVEVENDAGHPIVIWLERYDAYQEWSVDGYGWPRWYTRTRFAR